MRNYSPKKNRHVQHYNSYRNFIKKKFGSPVFKVPLSGGFSCPNRDGTKSSDGCYFCDNRSFSPAALRLESPVEQLLKTMNANSKRYKLFMPYLQPYSNTYGTVDDLSFVYEPLLSIPGVAGLAIGTRPDCFSEGIYSYLSDLNRRTYLSVEIGLQSAHNATLARVNRGHTVEEFIAVVNRLAALDIEIVAHIMLGLPGETPGMMQKTAELLSKVPICGVKIHQTMIIKGTVFEQMYNCGELSTLDLQNYGELLCDFLDRLRPDQLIHRIMADSKAEFGLIAPMWSAEKNRSLSVIQGIMDKRESMQGCCRHIVL